jgi:hypothetical protein
MAPPRRYNLNNSSRPSGSANSTGGTTTPSPAPAAGASKTPSGGGGSSGKNGNGIIGYFVIPTVLATLWLVTIGISLNNSIEISIFIVVFILTAINILFGKGASKWISLGLAVVMGCIIWGNYNYINSSTPPTEQSAGQQEQVAPAPVEDIIYIDPILPNTNRATNLVKTGNYTFSKGKNRLCFSRLGDEDGYHGQLIKVDGKEYNAGESGKCYPVTINQANVYVEFVYPHQSEVDTYALNRKEKNGQGVYPFLEPVQ